MTPACGKLPSVRLFNILTPNIFVVSPVLYFPLFAYPCLHSRNMKDFAAIILAAGKSTRMKSALPKPLHAVCGKPMSLHVVYACKEAGIGRCIVVVGHEADSVK